MERTTITVDELSEWIGISKDLVYSLCREKKIPHMRIGKRILFKISSVEKWLDEQEVKDDE